MNIKYITPQEAVKCVKSGNRVFIHGSAATPVALVNALTDRHNELKNIELVSITNLGKLNRIDSPEFRKSFYFNSLFISENIRTLVNNNGGDYRVVK